MSKGRGNYVLRKDGHTSREVFWREGNTPRELGDFGPSLSRATLFATERGAERLMKKLSRKEASFWAGVTVKHIAPA